MLPFKTLVTIDKESATPVYLQIANRLTALIREGRIKPGSSLPPSREMSALLQVHRKTIVAAYEEMFAQDWIETIPRKGVIVSLHLPEIKPRSFRATDKIQGYDTGTGFHFQKTISVSSQASKAGSHRVILNDGFPDIRIAPLDSLYKEYRRLLRRPAMQRQAMYGNLAGSVNLRTAIAEFISQTRGIRCEVKNIQMARGAQMAIYMAANIILKPGATVIVGDPDYFMGDMIFQQCSAKLVRVPVDENGINVDAIEKI
jgi:GntR family transcriptional regulator / MocR family aminotransferase